MSGDDVVGIYRSLRNRVASARAAGQQGRGDRGKVPPGVREVLHIRHYSLFTPRDFDLSPYFRVIKPEVEDGFDPHALHWRE